MNTYENAMAHLGNSRNDDLAAISTAVLAVADALILLGKAEDQQDEVLHMMRGILTALERIIGLLEPKR